MERETAEKIMRILDMAHYDDIRLIADWVEHIAYRTGKKAKDDYIGYRLNDAKWLVIALENAHKKLYKELME